MWMSTSRFVLETLLLWERDDAFKLDRSGIHHRFEFRWHNRTSNVLNQCFNVLVLCNEKGQPFAHSDHASC